MANITISLKGHSDTRWSAKKEAVCPLYNQIDKIYQVFQNISEDSSLNPDTVSGAKDLLNQIDFEFICLLDMWCKILTLMDRENNNLQSKSMSVDVASKRLKGLVNSIQNLREKGISSTFATARMLATKIGIDAHFPLKRRRRVKRMSFDESQDDGFLLQPESEFERQCVSVFDSILTQLKWRFEKLSKISFDFEFLRGDSLSCVSIDQLKKSAMNLAKMYPKDVDENELISEVESFKFQAESLMENLKSANPLDLLQLIHKYSLKAAYPNIEICLRIFLTLPVTVASCERSFSKLKIIKNYLRSSMGQDRLSNLSIISIESTLTNSLNYDDVINDFASLKARRVNLK
jgi:hypothetical protein